MNNHPTVGDILHYYTAKSGPEAAIVTAAGEHRVHIHVFGHGRPGFDRVGVWLSQLDKALPEGETSWCDWPPPEETQALEQVDETPAPPTPPQRRWRRR